MDIDEKLRQYDQAAQTLIIYFYLWANEHSNERADRAGAALGIYATAGGGNFRFPSRASARLL